MVKGFWGRSADIAGLRKVLLQNSSRNSAADWCNNQRDQETQVCWEAEKGPGENVHASSQKPGKARGDRTSEDPAGPPAEDAGHEERPRRPDHV